MNRCWMLISVTVLGCNAGGASGVAGAGGGGGSGGGGGGVTEPADSGTGPHFDGGWAIHFGATGGSDGLVSAAPVDANLRTVAAWQRLRSSLVSVNAQMTAWGLSSPAPNDAYQLLITAYHQDAWASDDSTQGGFLFAPVDLGWWFVAETNDAANASTTLYFMKEGSTSLTAVKGNSHASLPGADRFVIGTDDVHGLNDWLDGEMAGVKVWSAVLTQSELELEATRLSPVRTADLHAFYPLQTVETMLEDLSDGGRKLAPLSDAGTWSVEPGPAIPF